ncbi:hypothetical protein D0809_03395 [Flavobacterium circumlabens]|uniref:Uncharacterized protein n=1 Tax=Flavobacterium circumlabens TaxID=2133765 RepID=A0A4Y7UJT1_9FLAO|nr:hypothetical protein [Flavobacterium circumlabens]TCN60933.1 hypothetical protein EV142_101512 [Flavobacterium circumlabens]TEB46052.1 hypothetical protein D0809_03395 [Flavobacterium circumlabens]
MFNFFKRKEKIHLKGWEKELFQNIFRLLGTEYYSFEKQIAEGIIESVRFDKNIPDYISFKLNIALLNKFEKKNEQISIIKGIEVFDKTTNQYKSLSIDLGFNLILGYSIHDILNFNPDPNKINVASAYRSFYENKDFDKIKSLFTQEEVDLLNVSEIYEVPLDGKTYYHLKDLEDGDFLGIDINKNIFKITHDPFGITIQKDSLKSFF